MWRERLRNALVDVREGRAYTPPPEAFDELNDIELAGGIGTPLTDAAARSDRLIGEILEIYQMIGDKPFQWYTARTTTEAVLRNSYIHPRVHLFEYWKENGNRDRANELFVAAASEMRAASAPPLIMGAALYNLACARADQGRLDDAVAALDEGLRIRPDMKPAAADDADLAPLRGEPRFQELVKT